MRVKGHDSVEGLQAAARAATDANVRDRIRMVLHALEGDTAQAIAQRLGCSERVVRKWIQRYNAQEIKGLQTAPRSGRPRSLSAEEEPRLRERLNAGARPEDGVCALTGEDIRRILREEFGATYSLSGTYLLLHRLGYSSLVPRPRHPKHDAQAQAEFEKNTAGDGASRVSHASRR
jgi:transposase